MNDTSWANWSGHVQGHPAEVRSPASTADVVAAVTAATDRGQRVKPIGSRHSFTAIGVTDGVQLRLDRLDQVLSIDTASGLVTVQGGIQIRRLNEILAEHGLALENMGDIDQQTITGAISTGTHGTGARFGSIATQVRGLELVLANGSIVTCSANERPALFSAARVGLGALGIITAVTLQCVPSFALDCVEQPMPLDETLDRLDELVDGSDHFEFFWFPHTSTALTKSQTRLPGDTALNRLSPMRSWFDDDFVVNVGYEALLRVGTAFPRAIPAITKLVSGSLSSRKYTDLSHRVFPSRRDVRFNEGEYAVPRAALPELLRQIRRWVTVSGERVSFPLEIRFVAGDDIPLAPTYQRDSAYIAFHQYHRLPYQRYFDAVEDLFADVGGRPHWGKMHRLGAKELRDRYPLFDEFVALRDELDPSGVFGNDYLTKVLGDPS
ncbi:D-arabinono-1,4-lactone oxidase [Kribbella deserti]|uniref:D-arabinono-1,4-lactone oxidase n=1 Tax=Kribbella deserti TaxID=1926257 RepID=A0ABV6QIN1_9ACTN